jgi:radical SAM superfamily enzyme YgiQ (UPF0313 family)
MKIVLVFPPFFLEPMYNLPPLGLISLATGLKDSAHEVVVIDFVLEIRRKSLKMGKHIYEDCADRILAEGPQVVGFAAQCTTYPSVIQIGKIIKDRRPDIKVVIGGHNASFVDQPTLERFPFVDSIVRGEGEVTFKELVSAYAAGRNEEGVDGVTYRHGNDVFRNEDRRLIADPDGLPLPDYSFLPPLSVYRDACELPRSIAILEVGRGCPYHCVYCSESIMWRRSTRTFSVSRLVKEMENLHKNFGAECFLLAYDQFTAKRDFVESFCRKVIEKELDHLPWYCISRLDSVDASLLELMKRAGCESMCYGIDSGSKKTLSFIRKKIDKGILYQRVVETADQGIIPTLSFIIGFPEEEEKDIDETLVLALRAGIVGNNNPLIQLPTVLPGTDLHSRYRDRLVREVDTYFAMGLEFDEGRRLKSDEEMIDSHPSLFSSFYNLPCPGKSLEELNLIATYFPLVVRFYPKTFLLLSLDYGESVSGLFMQWLHWLRAKLKREALSLSPQDCYLHFGHFVSDTMKRKGLPTRGHLSEILRYEGISLKMGKFSSENKAFYIDLDKIREFKPEKNDKMMIQAFDFDIPVIILDLKAGRFRDKYPQKRTLLLFRQEDDILDVAEINAFSKDFLELCDGKSTLKVIAGKLFSRYGRDMKPGDFLDSCVEAAQIFGEQGLLRSGSK